MLSFPQFYLYFFITVVYIGDWDVDYTGCRNTTDYGFKRYICSVSKLIKQDKTEPQFVLNRTRCELSLQQIRLLNHKDWMFWGSLPTSKIFPKDKRQTEETESFFWGNIMWQETPTHTHISKWWFLGLRLESFNATMDVMIYRRHYNNISDRLQDDKLPFKR